MIDAEQKFMKFHRKNISAKWNHLGKYKLIL
jgi:hypothetical protein